MAPKNGPNESVLANDMTDAETITHFLQILHVAHMAHKKRVFEG